MNTTTSTSFRRSCISQQSLKHPLSHHNREYKMDIQGARFRAVDKAKSTGKQTSREKKLALLEDVDKLKKRLKYEENIHSALRRAFDRPLGSLPRLPPYLPPKMLELVAEIAVLEEEVVRLEEQVVTYTQNIHQDAVLDCSKKLTGLLKNPRQNFNRAATAEIQPHSGIARTTSASSDNLSETSSLSHDKTSTSTSSDSSGNMKAKSNQTNYKYSPKTSDNKGKGKQTDQQRSELQLRRNIQFPGSRIPQRAESRIIRNSRTAQKFVS